MRSKYLGVICRGSIALGTGCRNCEKCRDEIAGRIYPDTPELNHTLDKLFRAGRVRRWHTNLHMSDTDDRNDAHQGRVARIILLLHPAPSLALIAAALTHDDGEFKSGDLSGDTKRENPELREMIRTHGLHLEGVI